MEPQARWFKPCGIHYRKKFPRLVLDGYDLHAAVGFQGQACPASAGEDANSRAGTEPCCGYAAATNDSLADVAGAFKSISSIQVRTLRRKVVHLWPAKVFGTFRTTSWRIP